MALQRMSLKERYLMSSLLKNMKLNMKEKEKEIMNF